MARLPLSDTERHARAVAIAAANRYPGALVVTNTYADGSPNTYSVRYPEPPPFTLGSAIAITDRDGHPVAFPQGDPSAHEHRDIPTSG